MIFNFQDNDIWHLKALQKHHKKIQESLTVDGKVYASSKYSQVSQVFLYPYASFQGGGENNCKNFCIRKNWETCLSGLLPNKYIALHPSCWSSSYLLRLHCQIYIQSNASLMQTLADCGLPNGKGDSIEHSAFTFEVLFHTNISRDFQQGKPNWRADGRTHENYEIILKSPKMNPSKVKFPLIWI